MSKENDIYYYNDYAAYNGMRVGMLRDSFQNQEFRDYAAEKGFSYEESIYDTQEACLVRSIAARLTRLPWEVLHSRRITRSSAASVPIRSIL